MRNLKLSMEAKVMASAILGPLVCPDTVHFYLAKVVINWFSNITAANLWIN